MTKTVIIGGGLSGLAVAADLAAKQHDFHLLEARGRLGGRILAHHQGQSAYDLGPAWYWPGQPRTKALLAQLGLERFDQFAQGDLIYENEHAQVQRGRGFASMEGSYRVNGGFSRLIDALASCINDDDITLNAPVAEINDGGSNISVHTKTGEVITAQRIILALPPRVAAHIAFRPAFPQNTVETLNAIPTWMAGQAKALAIYDHPFWRDTGLSGDAMSRCGPMVEIHDASPHDEKQAALFGFIGVPPQMRQNIDGLRQATLAQLARLFGRLAAAPEALLIQDWAAEPWTTTQSDLQPLGVHPPYGLPEALKGLWQGRVIFAGTETADQFGGFLEGALEAAQRAAEMANQERST